MELKLRKVEVDNADIDSFLFVEDGYLNSDKLVYPPVVTIMGHADHKQPLDTLQLTLRPGEAGGSPISILPN